ncbi:MAG TPA: serine hydrolase domain-containing protein [Rhizomicrobium sp.]|jgi:CubicO group peptidase (beta-lactamase class C family)|nr:serine hydrolase domain-containing protein [Rhizomicrobium sp.]
MRAWLGLTAAAMILAAPAAHAASPAIDPVRLTALVDDAARQAMSAQHVAGMTVAVVDRNGPLLLKGYGTAGHGKPVDADTLFRVGSISKTVTWIAIMQLVEQGRLTLDDPINAHLPPDLRIPDDGFAEPIRIRHLMTHSAGFEDAILGINTTQDLSRLLTLHDYLKRYRVRRVRPPGEFAVYSNYSAALAGAIVEHETDMAFADYAERKILRPLGLGTATFREPYPAALVGRGFPAPLPRETAARVASGFRFEDGRFVEQSWEFLPHMAPAGALSASARDMAAYMQALLAPDRFATAHVLRAATALEMRDPTFRNDPRLGANLHGFWQLPTASGEFAFGHNGAMAFQQATLGIYPQSGIAVFVAIDSASLNGGAPSILTALPRQILNTFFAGARNATRVPQAAGASAGFAGCYRPLRRPYHHTERAVLAIAQTLCIDATPAGDLRLGGTIYVPIGNGVYARSDLSDRIAFGARGGHMLLFNFDSSGPSERVGFLETPSWLALSGALAILAALSRCVAGVVRMFRRRETAALLAVDLPGLLWLAGAALFAVAALPWLSDFSRPLLDYPGTALPLACWSFLAAAITSALAAVTLLVLRPTWAWLRWTTAAATLALYGVFAATLYDFGLLGFSGW